MLPEYKLWCGRGTATQRICGTLGIGEPIRLLHPRQPPTLWNAARRISCVFTSTLIPLSDTTDYGYPLSLSATTHITFQP